MFRAPSGPARYICDILRYAHGGRAPKTGSALVLPEFYLRAAEPHWLFRQIATPSHTLKASIKCTQAAHEAFQPVDFSTLSGLSIIGATEMIFSSEFTGFSSTFIHMTPSCEPKPLA